MMLLSAAALLAAAGISVLRNDIAQAGAFLLGVVSGTAALHALLHAQLAPKMAALDAVTATLLASHVLQATVASLISLFAFAWQRLKPGWAPGRTIIANARAFWQYTLLTGLLSLAAVHFWPRLIA